MVSSDLAEQLDGLFYVIVVKLKVFTLELELSTYVKFLNLDHSLMHIEHCLNLIF